METMKSHSGILNCRPYDKICTFEDPSVVLENGLERVGGGPESRVVIWDKILERERDGCTGEIM